MVKLKTLNKFFVHLKINGDRPVCYDDFSNFYFMKPNTYFILTGVLFFIIGTLHLLRLSFNWPVTFNGWALPLWPSVPAILVTYGLAFTAFKLKNERE